ncbi:hypothetical protein Tco_0332615, partial [Tanacetum coccineum]
MLVEGDSGGEEVRLVVEAVLGSDGGGGLVVTLVTGGGDCD